MLRLMLCLILCATAPDVPYTFKIPKMEAYEKGERCQLVNKTGRILARIDPGEYWNEGDGGLSHGGLTPVWLARPEGGWLCALRFEGKWQLRDLALLEIDKDGNVKQTALRPLIEAGADMWAKDARVPARAFNDHYRVLLCDADVKFEGPNTVVIRANADSNPKEHPGARWYCPLTFRYDIKAGQLSLAAGKLEVTK